MPDESVLVATADLPPGLREVLEEAIAATEYTAVWWDGGDVLVDVSPSLLIGVLPMGQRQVPTPLVRMITDIYPGLPLLLLCDEQLIRSTVSLRHGSITLVGPPLTADRVRERLMLSRSALSICREGAAPKPGLLRTSADVQTVEFNSARWSAVRLQRGTPASEEAELVARGDAERGFIGFVSQPHSEDAAGAEELGTRLLEADKQEHRNGAPPLQPAGDLPAVPGLWLSPRADRWTFFAPRNGVCARLYSNHRLPPYWNVDAALQRAGRACTIAAQAGDVVLLGWGLSAEATGKLDDQDAALRALHRGTHALRDWVTSLLEHDGEPAAVTLVEVH